ncbi:MAG TPA: DNA alkylation repair protein [Polyangiaceae bacterium]|jgi:3-methyladenine DNA glycosylase AlkD
MTLLASLRAKLRAAADSSRAPAMQAYMKSAMPFHGVPAPQVRAVCKDSFSSLEYASPAGWERDVRAIWDGARFREERYCALALTGVRAARAFQTPRAMRLYEHLVVSGAWWDYVDVIATNRVGPILRAHPNGMRPLLLRWAKGANMWKARTAILAQCRSREATDLDFLYACIAPSIDSKEFFLRKAIGWALREYAYVDPQEVARYVKKNEARLSGLSKREALKWVNRKD